MISPIYRLGKADDPTGEIARSNQLDYCAKLWRERSVVVLHPDDIQDDWVRQALENEADKKYGRRQGHG